MKATQVLSVISIVIVLALFSPVMAVGFVAKLAQGAFIGGAEMCEALFDFLSRKANGRK